MAIGLLVSLVMAVFHEPLFDDERHLLTGGAALLNCYAI